jgi:hypothetical protein
MEVSHVAVQMKAQLDVDALKRAWEAKDVDGILAFYADDAEMRRVNKNLPPKSPEVIDKGTYALRLRDIASRDLTTRVPTALAGGDAAALSFHCRYGDGTEVMSNLVLDVRDGKIVRHLEVEAWDAFRES